MKSRRRFLVETLCGIFTPLKFLLILFFSKKRMVTAAYWASSSTSPLVVWISMTQGPPEPWE